MENFPDIFEKLKRSFISASLFLMTVPVRVEQLQNISKNFISSKVPGFSFQIC